MKNETVKDIRNELVGLGLTEEEANSIKGKSALCTKREELLTQMSELDMQDEPEEYEPVYPEDAPVAEEDNDDCPEEYEPVYPEDDLSMTEESDETLSQVSDTLKDIKNRVIGSKDWQDYIMSKFEDSELLDNPQNNSDKLPCLPGLSRVGHELYNIFFSGPTNIVTAVVNGHPSATVTYKIDFYDADEDGNAQMKTYIAVADAWIDNMNSSYNGYPAAIAESRAEARAWKKLLHLRNKPAYEEISDKIEGMESVFDNETREGLITDAQISLIETKCEQFDIDVYKYINRNHFTQPSEYPKPTYESINEIPHNVALAMVKQLTTKYQVCTDDSEEIPEEIKK